MTLGIGYYSLCSCSPTVPMTSAKGNETPKHIQSSHLIYSTPLTFISTMRVGLSPTDRHFNSQLTKGRLSQASVINWGWEENIPGLRLPAYCPLLWPSQCFSLFRPLWAFLFHIMPDWAFTSSLSAHCLFQSFTHFLLSFSLSISLYVYLSTNHIH